MAHQGMLCGKENVVAHQGMWLHRENMVAHQGMWLHSGSDGMLWLIRAFGDIERLWWRCGGSSEMWWHKENMVVLLKERNELANASRNVRENTTATGRWRQAGFCQHYLKTSTQTQRYHHSDYYILKA